MDVASVEAVDERAACHGRKLGMHCGNPLVAGILRSINMESCDNHGKTCLGCRTAVGRCSVACDNLLLVGWKACFACLGT
jgi:hypothetical protein